MLALIFAFVATASPAPTAAPLATAEQLYEGAIARLASLHQAPYLAYEMDQTGYTRLQGILFEQGEQIIERRGDRAFHNVMTYGGTLAIGRHYLTPDEFIPNASLPIKPDGVEPFLDTPGALATAGPATSPSSIKTIAIVTTTASYNLTYVDDVTIADNFCGDAAHIKLDPKRDPDAFNVRELWIRRSDFALCAAIFDSWSFSGNGHTRSIDAAWLDERGFITNWRAQFLPDGNFDQGSFKDVRWQDSVPGGTYFSH